MELMILDLYVEEVHKGKQLDSADRLEERRASNSQAHQAPTKTNLQRAIDLYQEEHEQEASQEELLQAFKIFRDKQSAQIFISIQSKELRSKWLDNMIEAL
ncbi:hypothetical protein PtB15_4B381 [Puccinia triticina]|nr:hypothetical protein PtB15_4B381 [Puccinia triticina]